MSSIKTFEDLQNMGANIIHEQTHISRNKLELLLEKSFGDLTRLQFMGFVSILEREYSIDLSGLREEYDHFLQVHPDILIPKESVILQAQSRSRQKWILGSIALIVLLIGIVSFVQGRLTIAPQEEVMQLSSAAVEVLDQNLDQTIRSDVNTTVIEPSKELNTSKKVLNEQNATKVVNAAVSDISNATSIKPVYKVWVGILDMATGEKSQKITSEPIALDRTKNLLLMFGHGRLDVITPNGNKSLKEKSTVWFVYENGKLSQLSHEQFKAKNNGNNW